MEQQTLRNTIAFEGVGIHTGQRARVTVQPAEADTGRVFRVGHVTIPGRVEYVVDTRRCTTLGKDSVSVSTVEHLLSALHAYGIDNALIEVDGPEIPILDGSALSFAQAFAEVGTMGQGATPRVLALTSPLAWELGGTGVNATPADEFMVEVITEFDDWPEGAACVRAVVEPDTAADYQVSIAPARTFAFRREVEQLLAAGLALGGSLDNALVITPPATFSTPLRLPSEWCAHKLLDVIGDLALLDARLQMNLTITRPGHHANTRFADVLRTQTGFRREN